MNKIAYDNVYFAAWWLSVVTLPLTIPLNSFFIIVLIIIWLGEGKMAEKWSRLKNAPWVWPFLFFFIMHMIGLLYSQNLQAGLFELEKKLSFLIIPIVAASGPAFTKPVFNSLKHGFLAACLAIVVISLLFTGIILLVSTSPPLQNFDWQSNEQFHLLNPNTSRWWEYFSYLQVGEWIDIHPAYFSMYLIFCIAIMVQHLFEHKKISYYQLATLLLFTFFIVLLSSRMAILSFPVVIFYLVFYYYRKERIQYTILLTVPFLFVLFVLIWVNPVSRFRIIQETLTTPLQIDQNKKEWNSISFRLLEWRASFHEVKKHWLLGVGTGDGQSALQDYYFSFNDSTANLTYNAHNQYLQTSLELGLVGVSLLLCCLFTPFFSAVQPDPLLVVFIVLFGLMCLSESMLARQKGIVFFTLFQSLFLRSSSRS